MNTPYPIAYFVGLILTWLGIVIFTIPLFRYMDGKDKKYRISIPGWIVAGSGSLILAISTGKLATFSVWLISFIGILIVKGKQKE